MPRHHHEKDDEDLGMGDIGKDPSEFSICSLDQVPVEKKPEKSRKKSVTTKEPEREILPVKRFDLAQKLKEEFREMQQKRKESRINHLVLGKGLGNAAEETLKEGYYIPTKVMEDVTEEDKKLWTSMDFKPKQKPVPVKVAETRSTSAQSKSVKTRSSSNADDKEDTLSCMDAFDSNPLAEASEEEEEAIPIMEKFRCTYKPVNAILETRAEISENIRTSENELEAVCFPFTFKEMFETLNEALIVVERGRLHEKVTLPMYVRETPSSDSKLRQEQLRRQEEDPLYLVGARAVLEFVRHEVLPKAYEVVPIAHNVQWMLQYSVAFLKSIVAQNKEEAQVRVELLAHCVRLLASTESFSAIALSLESKAEEYDAFEMLKEGAEQHLGKLLDDIEEALKAVLAFPFPQRRQQLNLVERGIQAKLRHILLFLNEIDYSWIPTVYFQTKWKLTFLSDAFRRIHEHISQMYVECSMGFIDNCLYELVKDSRVSGKVTGGAVMQAKVPRALQVEYDRVTSRMRFQVIAISLKGSGSRLVGLQLCMGARYILRQSTPDFDHLWAFPMNEPPMKETDEDEKANIISDFYARVRRQIALDQQQREFEEEQEALHEEVNKILEEALSQSSSTMISYD